MKAESRRTNKYIGPHTAIHVSSYCYTRVLILLYTCPHTALHVSSYCYVSVYCYICVHIQGGAEGRWHRHEQGGRQGVQARDAHTHAKRIAADSNARGDGGGRGAHVTCFTSTTVQILTQKLQALHSGVAGASGGEGLTLWGSGGGEDGRGWDTKRSGQLAAMQESVAVGVFWKAMEVGGGEGREGGVGGGGVLGALAAAGERLPEIAKWSEALMSAVGGEEGGGAGEGEQVAGGEYSEAQWVRAAACLRITSEVAQGEPLKSLDSALIAPETCLTSALISP
jgi:hypothetical protein